MQAFPETDAELAKKARFLEFFLYRLHELFWFERAGSTFRVVGCNQDLGLMCLLAGVGLGIMPVGEYLRMLSPPDAVQDESVVQCPKVRPRDGVSSEMRHVDDADDDYFDRRRAWRLTLIRVAAIALMLVGIGYYIVMDILYPAGW